MRIKHQNAKNGITFTTNNPASEQKRLKLYGQKLEALLQKKDGSEKKGEK